MAAWHLHRKSGSENIQDYFPSFSEGKSSTEKPQGEHPVLGNECHSDLRKNMMAPDSVDL